MGKSKSVVEPISDSSPAVEATDLRSVQGGFESHLSHQHTDVELLVELRHYESIHAVLEPMDDWCGGQGYPFTSRPTHVDLYKGTVHILYVFEQAEHATLFALTFNTNPVILKINIT